MIRNFIICLTFLLFQNNSIQKDFLKYHQEFSIVEELIVNEDFKEAEILLKKLLTDFKPPFAKDYVIAAQISLINNNKSKALYWLQEAFKHGVKIRCLKEITIFNKELNVSDWQKIDEEFDAFYAEY